MVTGKRTDSLSFSPARLKESLKGLAPLRSHLSLHFGKTTAAFWVQQIDGTNAHSSGLLEAGRSRRQALELLADQEHSFKSVSLSYLTPHRTLIADGLCDADSAETYLRAVCELERNVTIIRDSIESIGAQMVYAMPKDLLSDVHATFPTCTTYHAMTIGLEHLHRLATFDQEPFAFIHLAEGQMELCLYKDRRPLFFNTFSFETETDVIYHLLHTLELHAMDHAAIRVLMAGQVTTESDEYKMVKAYCPDCQLEWENTSSPSVTPKDFIISNQYACG